MKVNLKFINRSLDGNTSEVVIYQKNLAMDMVTLTKAWKTIKFCGRDCYNLFTYTTDYEIGISDSYGNYSPYNFVPFGKQVIVTNSPSPSYSRRIDVTGNARSSKEIEILNKKELGSINAGIYNDKRLIAEINNVAPGQKAVFQYIPTIWIGIASQINQGNSINSAIISSITKEISLVNISSADIVMTGGGPGQTSTPYTFNLENIARL